MTPQDEMMLNDLEETDAELTEWEENFVGSLRNHFDSNPEYRLTTAQYDKLSELWERYCDD